MTQEEVEKTFAGLSPYFAYKQGLQDAVAYTWDSFRREAAKDILAGMVHHRVLSDSSDRFYIPKEQVVSAAIGLADELIKQLREERK